MQKIKPSYQEIESELFRLKEEIEILKSSERSRIVSSALHSKMVSNIGDVIVIIDKDEINRYKSPNIEKLFGWKPEEVVGECTWNNIHPDELETAKKFLRDLLKTPNSSGVTETRYKCKDGTYKWIEFKGSNMLHDPDINGILGNYHDISNRKLAENALRISQEQYHLIDEASQDLIYSYNRESRFTHANSSMCKLLGLSLEQIIGKTHEELGFPPEQCKEWASLHKQVYDTDLTVISETVSPIKDGTMMYFEVVLSPMHNLNNEIIGIAGTTRNITNRKKSEKALQESEERYRRIIESINDYMYTVTIVNGKVKETHHGEGCKAVTGYSSDEYDKDPYLWLRMVVPEDRWIVQEQARKLFEKENPFDIEHRVIHKNGSERWVKNTLVPRYNENGELISYDGLIKDITERKQTEARISESEEKFRLLFENMTAGFALHEMIYDQNGNPVDYRYIEVNPAFEKLTGAKAEELIGHTVKEVMPETEQHWIETFGKVAKTGETVSYQNFAREIGRYFDVWAFSPAPDKFAVVFVDITERLRHESEIEAFNEELAATNEELTVTTDALRESNLILEEAKSRAEESDRLKTAFLANMSHEIRTPMNGILGFSELLKTPNLTGEKQLEFISIIEKSGERMLNIINDLINISKIESGLMELSFSDTNINEQLEFLFNFFKTEARQKGLELTVKCPLPNENAIITTDKEKVYAILTNLLKNAVKFTKSGSIEFGYSAKHEELEFYVKDTGIGIPADKQKLVFDRFVQAESSVSRGYEGSGLGLSISKAYVEMLGGNIRLESEVDKGSCFYLSLPVKIKAINEDTKSIKNNVEPNIEMMDYTILIAEDDDESFLYLSIILEATGLKILHAKTGEEAVSLCRSNKDVKLILMDIKMPKMDGHTAAKIIKGFRPELPIIAQTAFALETEKEKYSQTFDDYITKPIKASILKEKMSKYY